MKKSFTVLIVDDDEDDRSIFCDIIHEIFPKAKCITAQNGIDALEKLKSENNNPPDLIFLDINMPRMNGKECLAVLKRTPCTQQIPVVIYTTSKLEKDEVETRQLGAVDFLSKPAKSNDLKCKIGEIIEGIMHFGAIPTHA